VPWIVDPDCHAKFKRHVKAGRARSGDVELHPRQIVNRVSAGFDQRPDAFETPLAEGDFEGRARKKPVCAKTRDIGQ
jgi:hypothetical protein